MWAINGARQAILSPDVVMAVTYTNPNPKVRKSGAVGKAVLVSMVLKSAGRWDHRALRWTGACYWHGVGGFMFNSS